MKRIPLKILIPFVLFFIICAFFFGSDEAKLNADFFKNPFLWGVMIIAVLMIIIIDGLDKVIQGYKLSLLNDEERALSIEESKKPFYSELFTQQTEKVESEILIDHGFDGIKELDNSLPKWWLGILYVTMFYAFIYLISASFFDFSNPIDEYDKSVAKAEAEKVKPTLDQVVQDAKFDAGLVSGGQKIFENNCVTCHQKGGLGAVGPNLTDEFWKNQRTDEIYTNVVNIVWSGVDGTAMVAWGEDEKLTQDEVYQVAAYVESLRGTKIGGSIKPKAPEGTLAPWSKGSVDTNSTEETNEKQITDSVK